MFKRRKATDDAPSHEADSPAADPAVPGRKNRPTRSRKEAEAARKRPLVIDDRKEARRKAREERVKLRNAEHEAMMSGDEAHMPERDRGPVKSFVRDFVDSRWNVGEYSLFILLIPVLVQFVATSLPNPQLWLQVAFVTMWVIMFALIGDSVFVLRKTRKLVKEHFGEKALFERPGTYAMMRALQFRRLRLPKPKVRHGAKLSEYAPQ